MKRLSPNEQATLILILAILFGAWFRIMPAWLAGFPVNDGGMFYMMILDLQANHYVPPLFTTYNNLAIPFAYPPLGFYLGAFLSDLFNLSPLIVLRWLPGILNALTVPAFYFFAREVLADQRKGALAALVFALIPHLSTWLSMGGGLTRSLGLLFMLLTIAFAHRMFSSTTPPRSAMCGVIVFASLTLLSHTESSVFALAISIFIWLMKSRSWAGLQRGMIVAVAVIFISALWYGLVISLHGLAPYLSVLHTGGHSLAAALKVINVDLMTEETYLDIFGAIGILGCVLLVTRREYFIPALLVFIYIAQPRSAHTVGNLALALAAAVFLFEIFFAELLPIVRPKVFAGILLPFLLLNSLATGFDLARSRVTDSELDALQWADENLPADARLLVINGETAPTCDALTEWFPALAQRESVVTMQGREWLLGAGFVEFIARRDALQGCFRVGLPCLAEQRAYFTPVDYIFISQAGTCSQAQASPLLADLQAAQQYRPIYAAGDVFIFANIP